MVRNEILHGLEYFPRAGVLSFKGVRYMIIRPETLMGIQKAAEKALGHKADGIFYSAGFTGGYLSSKKYRDVFGLKPAGVARFMARMGGQIGWGKLSIEKLDLANRSLTATAQNSPFAAAYGRSRRPVCHILRGIFGGLGEVIFGTPVKVIETQCAAKGDKLCRFEASASRIRR